MRVKKTDNSLHSPAPVANPVVVYSVIFIGESGGRLIYFSSTRVV
jgi:hypothetical protein